MHFRCEKMRPKDGESTETMPNKLETEEATPRQPSTSKENQVCSIDDATTIFERLHITQGKSKTDHAKPSPDKKTREQRPDVEPSLESHCYHSLPKSKWRWRPYFVPKNQKTTRSDSDIIKTLEQIKWREEVDVDELRNKLLIALPCSVEASRSSSQPDHEIDELAEYFGCFVCVETKMSALAESMYC